MTARLEGFALRAAVEDLLFDYADALDTGALDRWPGFFAEHALYEVISRENVDQGLPLALVRCDGRRMMVDRATAIKDMLFHSPRTYRHMINNVRPTWNAAEPATIGSPSSLIPARNCSSERGVGRQTKPASA